MIKMQRTDTLVDTQPTKKQFDKKRYSSRASHGDKKIGLERNLSPRPLKNL